MLVRGARLLFRTKPVELLILILRLRAAFLLPAPSAQDDLINMNQAPAALRDRPSRQDVNPASAEKPRSQFNPPLERSLTRPTDYSVVQKHNEMLVRKILVPTDFSPTSAGAVGCGVALANQFNAALTILHVVDINRQVSSGTAQDLMRNLWAEGSTQLGQLAWSLPNQVRAQTIVDEGLPWEVIVEKSHDFDLLVLGKTPCKMRWNGFSQHTAQRVLENAACPVMVVHHQS